MVTDGWWPSASVLAASAWPHRAASSTKTPAASANTTTAAVSVTRVRRGLARASKPPCRARLPREPRTVAPPPARHSQRSRDELHSGHQPPAIVLALELLDHPVDAHPGVRGESKKVADGRDRRPSTYLNHELPPKAPGGQGKPGPEAAMSGNEMTDCASIWERGSTYNPPRVRPHTERQASHPGRVNNY